MTCNTFVTLNYDNGDKLVSKAIGNMCHTFTGKLEKNLTKSCG